MESVSSSFDKWDGENLLKGENAMSQDRKFVAVAVECLPEDISEDVKQGWIENPNGLRKTLKEALCPPFVPRVWKTIKLGIGPKTADDFRKSLKDNGFRIGDWANDILGKPEFTVATGEREVDLVRVTVAELGFKDGACRDHIYDRVKELGLELCPLEVGPQLRLQYKDQPNGEWILIGMEPIRDSVGYLDVFHVGHDGDGQWLDGNYGSPAHVWSAGLRWVFVRPRKCQKWPLDSWSFGSR